MHTVQEMDPALGQNATLETDRLFVDVKILDCKVSYGQERCLVAPLSGSGRQWVSVDRLSAMPRIRSHSRQLTTS